MSEIKFLSECECGNKLMAITQGASKVYDLHAGWVCVKCHKVNPIRFDLLGGK